MTTAFERAHKQVSKTRTTAARVAKEESKQRVITTDDLKEKLREAINRASITRDSVAGIPEAQSLHSFSKGEASAYQAVFDYIEGKREGLG